MSRNQIAIGLVAILFVSVLANALFCWRYAGLTRDLHLAQVRIAAMNGRLNLAQALLNDTIEYSRRNPAVDPLLRSLNLKTNSAPVSTPAPRGATR